MAAKLSTKVLSMRFMQKSFEKKRAEELALNAPAEDAEEHWVSHQRSGDEGCVVLLEGDPPPANGSGRMSFQGFKTAPKTAYNMQPTEAADGDREGDGQEGVSVVDEVMAASLGKKEQKQKQNKGGSEKQKSSEQQGEKRKPDPEHHDDDDDDDISTIQKKKKKKSL